MLPALAAAAVAAPVITGIMGNQAAAADRAAAQAARQRALDMIMGINVPDPEQQKVAYEQLQSQGQLTPEMVQAMSQQDSRMNDVVADPRLKDAQMQALAQLQGIAQSGGNDAISKLSFNQMQSQLGQEAAAKQAAVMQDFARRGQAGSGMELAAQLMNQQNSAQNASMQGMQQAAAAQQRALDALSQGGQMAGAMRSQGFNEQAAAAQAQDAINRFNTQNRQDVMNMNTATRNQAQAANLQNAQTLANQNVAIRNQQQDVNKSLLQQQFDNRLKQTGMATGQLNNIANGSDAAADRTGRMWAGIGQGVSQGIGGYMAYGSKKPNYYASGRADNSSGDFGG